MDNQANLIHMPAYGKRIVSRQGNGTYITIDSNKVVSIKQPAMLDETPNKDEPSFDLVLSGEITPGIRTENDKKWTVTRDIGFIYDDSSITTAISIAGCIVAYRPNASMDLYPHQNPSKDGRLVQYRGIYGVTTVSVGIPEERYFQLMGKLEAKYKQFKYVDDEDIDNGYVWVNASIGTKKYPEDNAEYEELFQNQVIVASSDNRIRHESIGPIRDVLRSIGKSLKVIIYGALRLKTQLSIDSERRVRRYKLGMSVNYFQLYDISERDGPGLRDVAGVSTINTKFVARARLRKILDELSQDVIQDDNNNEGLQDEGIPQSRDDVFEEH